MTIYHSLFTIHYLISVTVGAGIAGGVEVSTRVFKVGDGDVMVSCSAPASCSEDGDTIRVYNSCDIAKTSLVPLSKTRHRDEIASKKISCPTAGWTGTAALRQTHQFDCDDTVQEGLALKELH